MGQTIAEKILSQHRGNSAAAGNIVQVEPDLFASNDESTPPAIQRFNQWDAKLADPDRVALVPDHYQPSHESAAQERYNAMEDFADEHDITHFYPLKETGLMHAVLPEEGLVKPGDIVVGADSHTVTYGALGAYATGVSYTDLAFGWEQGWTWLRVPETVRVEFTGQPSEWVRGKDLVLRAIGEIGVDGAVYQAIEFGGPAIEALPMDDRFSVANMAIEAGGAAGLVDPDETTKAYVEERVDEDVLFYSPDDDAEYAYEVEIDCEGLEPQVAVPNLPSDTEPVLEVAGTSVDQVVVGSCTNCRVEDLRQAAEILEGHEIDPGVRMIVTPGSRNIQSIAYEEGWMQIFNDAGCTMGNPGCGACFGHHIGVLDEDEIAVSTTNRNFIGRMGANSSEVYLSNPSVAAASAITGEITHPEEVI